MTIKIATYNIQYGVGQDERYDLARIAEAVRGQDIIALQEVTRHWPASRGEDQPQVLTETLGLYSTFAPALDIAAESTAPKLARRQFGNMVLSRWPILYARSHALPRPAVLVPDGFKPKVDMPRVALEAVIDCDGQALRVFSTHLSHLPGLQRQAQLDALRQILRTVDDESPIWDEAPAVYGWRTPEPGPPVPQGAIVLGDFNMKLGSADYAHAVAPPKDQGAELFDAWPLARESAVERATCLNYGGGQSVLDYMLVTAGFRDSIAAARVGQDITGSDHYPVFFDLDRASA